MAFVPGWPEGPGPETMNTDLASPFLRPVFLDSGLADFVHASERRRIELPRSAE